MNDQTVNELVKKHQLSTHQDGKLQFIVGLCEKVGLPEIFNRHLK